MQRDYSTFANTTLSATKIGPKTAILDQTPTSHRPASPIPSAPESEGWEYSDDPRDRMMHFIVGVR